MYNFHVLEVEERFEILKKSQQSLLLEIERLNAELEILSENTKTDSFVLLIEQIMGCRKHLTILLSRLKNIDSRLQKYC